MTSLYDRESFFRLFQELPDFKNCNLGYHNNLLSPIPLILFQREKYFYVKMRYLFYEK
jgi:hypothetical protein